MIMRPRKFFANFCNILSHLICPIFCCFASCSKPSYVKKDTCCYGNTSVLESLTIPKLNNMKKQPIFVCYENSAKDKDNLKTPFAVIEDTHDKENKTIVITIRGTAQPSDVLIDAVAKPKLIWDSNGKYAPDDEQRQTMIDDKEWENFKGKFPVISICLKSNVNLLYSIIKLMIIFHFYNFRPLRYDISCQEYL